MTKIISTAAAGLALLALPLAAADARPGTGPRPDHAPPSAGQSYGDPAATDRGREGREGRDARGQRRAERRCQRVRKVGFAVRGTLSDHTADDVTLTIVRATRHARSFLEGDSHTFALDRARVKFAGVTDADGSGEVDWADVAPTDVVRVFGKVTRPKRGCDAERTVTVRKVHVVRPDAVDSEDNEPEGQQPEAPEGS